MFLNLVPIKIFKANCLLITVLVVANVLGIIAKHGFGHDHVYGLVGLFDFNLEANIPTLYSSMALIVASTLLALTAFLQKHNDQAYIAWLGLSLIFVFLSIDEVALIHESFATPTREALGTSGLLYYAWIIPYGAVLILFFMVYFKFLISLPARTRLLFMISGSIFVAGAIGFEMLGGYQKDMYGSENILYALLYTTEESLEMFGIALFIYALLDHLSTIYGRLALNFGELTNTAQ